jgi:hypothetical protein
MASAPRLDPDVTSSLAEKGQKPKSPVVASILSPSAPSPPDVSVSVPETETEKGYKRFAQALGFKAGRKSRKHKKRAHKKTQKRRARK